MRLFSFIMAFLVLFLSVAPCADEGPMCLTSKNEISSQGNENTNPFNDSCSPFCQCNCCAGFSINHQVSTLPEIVPVIDKFRFSFITPSILEVSIAIWQPPRFNS